MKFINAQIESCHTEYVKLIEKFYSAVADEEDNEDPNKSDLLSEKSDRAKKTLDDYAYNIYSKAIYDTYSAISPMLLRVSSGKKYRWNQVFKMRFEKLDALDKNVLIALVEGNGGYRLV